MWKRPAWSGIVTAPSPPTPAQVVPATAVTPSDRAALVHIRQQTHAQLVAIRQRLTPEQIQQVEAQARARVSLREQNLGYGLMVQSTVEAILCEEYLGFDCWPRLVAQIRASGVVAEEVLAACSLEAILDEVLVVSVPTAQDHARFTAHALGTLEELASTPTQRRRVRVLRR